MGRAPERERAAAIAADLSTLLGTERIVMFPWPVGKTVDQQVVVEVLRFEGTSGGDVVLEARWRILGPDKQEVLLRYSIVREPAGGARLSGPRGRNEPLGGDAQPGDRRCGRAQMNQALAVTLEPYLTRQLSISCPTFGC